MEPLCYHLGLRQSHGLYIKESFWIWSILKCLKPAFLPMASRGQLLPAKRPGRRDEEPELFLLAGTSVLILHDFRHWGINSREQQLKRSRIQPLHSAATAGVLLYSSAHLPAETCASEPVVKPVWQCFPFCISHKIVDLKENKEAGSRKRPKCAAIRELLQSLRSSRLYKGWNVITDVLPTTKNKINKIIKS